MSILDPYPPAANVDLCRYAAASNAGVPGHLVDGLVRFIVLGILPGHFLRAVLSNNLYEAFARADAESRQGLYALVVFLHNQAPGLCWGSPDKMSQWVTDNGLQEVQS